MMEKNFHIRSISLFFSIFSHKHKWVLDFSHMLGENNKMIYSSVPSKYLYSAWLYLRENKKVLIFSPKVLIRDLKC